MARYSHPDLLDNGIAYLKANCDKVILTDAYTSDYATANGSAKVGETTLVTGDFTLSGADGASRVLTAALTGKSAGNALQDVADGTNMHLVFVATGTTKVLHVTEESTDQAIASGNPVTLNSSFVLTATQPTA